MIQQAPDLELGGPPPTPPAELDGDHLPERDWLVIALLATEVLLGLYIVQSAARMLWREFRA